MDRNVYSFRIAIAKGFEPLLYTYDPDKMPLGLFNARLDFKTWSKRIIAINCYFTKIETEEKFIVTVYCNHKTGKFKLPDSVVDFSSCPTNEAYLVSVLKNERGKIYLSDAKSVQKINQ